METPRCNGWLKTYAFNKAVGPVKFNYLNLSVERLRELWNYLTGKKQQPCYFPRYSVLLFILAFAAIAFIYDYHHILVKPPQSLHHWRQADCLSLTQHYFEDEVPFLSPQMHNLGTTGNGKTMSDFPLIYYGIGKIWQLTGKHYFIYRSLVLLLFFTSLLYWFKFLEKELNDTLLPLFTSLLLFSSPTMVYYAANFLMDIPAFSMALLGFVFFMKYWGNGKTRHLVFSCVFYTLGGLLKVSALLSFFAVMAGLILSLLPNNSKPGNKQKDYRALVSMMALLGVCTLWFLYSARYNTQNNSGIFLVGILPIWDLNVAEIDRVFHAIAQHIKWDYFRIETQIVWVFLWLITLFNFKKLPPLLAAANLLMPLGMAGFSALFFQALKDHDYYTVNLFIAVPVLITSLLFLLKHLHPQWRYSWGIKLLCLAFLVHNIDFSRRRMESRYHPEGWQNKRYSEILVHYSALDGYLSQLNISKNDRILSISDNSINITLQAMNRKGWTAYEPLKTDTTRFSQKIKLGARYVIAETHDCPPDAPWMQFIEKQVGLFHGIAVFKIKTRP